ncbi:hypothetical protein [Microbulbifer sp. 2205BS26-8]|uniref:hypothetical protein n=1 Tax=Microbulbifer sp. 2205BS26-8 TaxID=3064386 RepID=UPI00273DD5B4|nr:hypothetical protein [Microbulbifer sp. 2205BS26-8]MDP5209392.1 hypothetical protein [Microbulbifer sp. 2205BS26-8]
MKSVIIISIEIIVLSICLASASLAQNPICAENSSPYRDLDFLIGDWEFYSNKGNLIANQTYHKKEQGCLILEDWKTISGETGTGMNFFDPETKKWRQVWMSPRFHIDYSGGINESGDFILEGKMHPNNGEPGSAIKGIYTRNKDGSITKEFLKYDDKENNWKRFFIGIARKSQESLEKNDLVKSKEKFKSCHATHELSAALNFLPGKYNYYLGDGKKIGQTEYKIVSGGCAILEQFKNNNGELSIGVLNLDVNRSKWRHFWSSKRFTFEVFGGPNSDEDLFFEGDIVNHSSGEKSPFRGTWFIDNKGNVKHTYEIYDLKSESWRLFLSDVSEKI